MSARSLAGLLIALLAVLSLICIALIREIQTQKAELNEIKAQAEIEAQNKALVRREYEEVLNQGELDRIDEIYTADFVIHTPGGGDIHGIEGVKAIANMFYTAFPDMQYKIEDMIAEGDKAAVRWKLTGTHKGELMGIPPTGVQVSFTGNTIHRFAGGKYVELWSSWEARSMWQQLGVDPPSSQGEE